MIAAFTRLDLSSWFPRTQTTLTLLFVVAVGVLLPVPGMAIIASALVTSLMVSAPFLGDERGRLDTLYGVLPVSRSTVVIGRTVSIIAYYLVAAALATAVTVISAMVRGGQTDTEVLLIAHTVALAFVGLSMALQLPVLFRIGYTRGRLMAYTPAFAVAGIAWLLQTTGTLAPVQEAFERVPVAAIGGGGALIGILGIICAIIVSARLYRTREL
ncbi:ABC-2 transporter permease [Microbacterium sp. A196]|uniref:ABC-2 transporter permease n=1 Tax=unclassified Microbacterium TaxID=2609290 RepID=UPI003FD34121